jgi:hypothetical protein
MAKGQSGRIVIEVSQSLKRELYSALAIKDQTLKDWFIKSANQFLHTSKAPLNPADEIPAQPSGTDA